MLGGTTTGNTATATMTNTLASLQEYQEPTNVIEDNIENENSNLPLPKPDHEFNQSQCLICNSASSDLDQNLTHMSIVHGLHIETTNLLVDIESLLAYLHLVISGYYECLYCGTQRNTRQAAQQHMIAKGHCKIDLTSEDSEMREFYDFSELRAEEELTRNVLAVRLLSDDAMLVSSRARSKKKHKSHPSRGADRHDHDRESLITTPQVPSPCSTPQTRSDAGHPSSDNNASRASHSPLQVSQRTQKREHTVDNQLSRLRTDDRKSLMHLPVSQQRALLLTHHKQMEKARRAEQTLRGNLESAGNSFARLGTIRLIRKPPHTGRVQTLKR